MSLPFRRALYLSFILAFLILTPLLIFYSLGYNLKSGFIIEKSGMLVIDTEPKGAKIIIEDKGVQKFWSKILTKNKNFIQTPAKIKNLKPGEYKIEVNLAGYWPWLKKLTISPGKTTFAEDIYLFKNNEPTLIEESLAPSSSFSPDNKYFVYIDKNQAQLVDLASTDTKIVKFKNNSSNNDYLENNIRWSSNEKRVLNNSHIFSINDWDTPLFIESLIGEGFSNFGWDADNDHVLIYSYDNKIFSFDTGNNHNKEILEVEKLNSFLTKDNNIYLVEQNNTTTNFEVFNRYSDEKEVKLELPLSDYSFVNTDHALINLLDIKHDILYIIDPNSKIKVLKEVLYGTKEMQWITNSTLLYTTGFEIWIFDLNSLEKKLLTRISEPINNIEWHPSNNYIVFSTAKSINILELDNREKHSTTRIVNFDNIDKMVLDKKGEIIYFTTEKEGVSKLYKIFIQ